MNMIKHLNDALFIIDREHATVKNSLAVSLTDITDSDDNFARRLANTVSQQDLLQAQVEKWLTAFDVLEADRMRMVTAREQGHAFLDAQRAAMKQLDINRKTIQLAILQVELASTQ